MLASFHLLLLLLPSLPGLGALTEPHKLIRVTVGITQCAISFIPLEATWERESCFNPRGLAVEEAYLTQYKETVTE